MFTGDSSEGKNKTLDSELKGRIISYFRFYNHANIVVQVRLDSEWWCASEENHELSMSHKVSVRATRSSGGTSESCYCVAAWFMV